MLQLKRGDRTQIPPKWVQDGPKMAQDGPKLAQDGPKMAPEAPMMAPEAPKMDPTGPQEGSQVAPKSVFQGIPASKPKKGDPRSI